MDKVNDFFKESYLSLKKFNSFGDNSHQTPTFVTFLNNTNFRYSYIHFFSNYFFGIFNSTFDCV